jgi:hypothetical protein
MIALQRTVDATVEPVTLGLAADHCVIDADTENELLSVYIKAAREYAEKYTGRAFLEQTWRLSLDRFPGWMTEPWRLGTTSRPGFGFSYSGFLGPAPILLPRPRLMAVASVTYLDPSGVRQTLNPSLYAVDADAEPARILPKPGTYWPSTAYGRSDVVQVTYTAGYGDTPDTVPASVQLAILGLVAHWYENRESVVLTNSTNAVTVVPKFVDSLLDSEAAPPIFSFEGA